MNASRETRLEMLRSTTPFVFASSAQYVNGEGVSLMILNRWNAQLTVGNSWLDLPMENARRDDQDGWVFYLNEVAHWTGGAAEGSEIDSEELQAITNTIVQALAAERQFANFVPENKYCGG